MEMQESLQKFMIWYVDPIEKLKALPNGAGGFVAFIIGIVLYERLIGSRLRLNNQKSDDEAIKKAINNDLRLAEYERTIFWNMFRNGLLHQAMLKSGKTGYMFHHSFTGYPEFIENNGQK